MSVLERAGLLAAAKRLLHDRTLSYRRIFLGHGVDTDEVLSDLAKFCRASETTYHVDQRLSDVLIGRREVFLRISQHLNLSHDQLWELFGNKNLPPEPKETSWEMNREQE